MSLRARLTISYISFFAAALIALDIGLYFLVRQALISGIDYDLNKAAIRLQQNFESRNRDAPTVTRGEVSLLLLAPPSIDQLVVTRTIVQVHLKPSIVADRAPVTNLAEAIAVDQALLQQAFTGQTSMSDVTTDDVHLRETIVPLEFRNEIIGAIQIARPLTETDHALQLLTYALVGGGVIVLLAAARGGMWLTRAAFKPINEVTATAQSIVGAEDLSRRVPVPAAQDELQRLTVTINDLLARLEQLFTAQQRFLADVSHELRTPLAAMSGNLEVLERGAARDPALLHESLADMRSEVSRLIRMVNDLLLLAQSEAGVELRREPVELDTLLLEVHRELRPLAHGIDLRIGYEDQVTVIGDRDRIKQALLNLAANAIQHTSAGGSVTLGLSMRGQYAALSIADTGCGIASQDLPLIFDRFYRADKARTRVRGGAGLGLPIVKRIADMHAGDVVVESAAGVGSTFTLLLPLMNVPNPPDAALTVPTLERVGI